MQHQALLENYLRQLRLSTFAQNYQTFAQDATRTNLSYERYLLALCQAEAEQREANRIERAILNAKFPIMKEFGESYRFRQRMQLEEQAASEQAR